MSYFPNSIFTSLIVIACLSSSTALPGQSGTGDSPSSLNRVWEIIKGHDDDGDGVVTREEFDRSARAFDGYDLDGDGRLTREEMDQWVSSRSRGRAGRGGGRTGAGRSGAGARGRGPSRMVGALGDTNADGVVTRDEWSSSLQAMVEEGKIPFSTFQARLEEKGLGRMVTILIDRMDPDGTGYLSIDSVDAMFTRADADGDGRVEVTGNTAGQGRPENPGADRRGGNDREQEPRRPQRGGAAPLVGDIAPDFVLPLASDAEQNIQLSQFAGKKPVALIFGSYT